MLKEAERFSTNAAAAEDEDEDELAQIRRRRLEHLRNVNRSRITEIPNKDVFLSTIEDTRQGHEAVIHIYRDDMEATQTLNEALLDLASQTRNVRFFKVRSSALEMTKQFVSSLEKSQRCSRTSKPCPLFKCTETTSSLAILCG